MKIDILDAFTAHLKQLHRSPKTIKEYRRRLNRWRDYLHDHEAGAILLQATALKWVRYRKSLLALNYSQKTVNSFLNTLSTFYRWAIQQGLIARDPLAGARYFKTAVAASPRLATRQVEQLRAWFDTLPVHLRASYYMMYGAGLTPEETSRLQASDVWLSGGVMYVHAGRLQCERTVPIMKKDAAQVLYTYWSARQSAPGPLFRVSSLYLYQHDRRFSAFPFHCLRLRHDFAIKLCEANMPLQKIQRLMGHPEILMTMYAVRHAQHDLEHIRPAYRLAWADRGEPV